MLSSVTINSQATKIVMNPGSQLSLNCQNCSQCLKCHKSLGLLLERVLKMSLYLSLSIFFGHVMSFHHSEQMSQRSQVSRIALWRCSQNVFVFVFVFVIVFVFVFVFLNFFGQFMSSHHCEQMYQRSQVTRIALRRCSQNVFVFVFVFAIVFVFVFGQVVSSYHSDQMSQRSQVSKFAPLGCSLMEVHR